MVDNKNLMLLKLLKEQYDKRTISVLIGSGFSKNALSYFPSWNELLKKLVIDLFGRRIKDDYSLHKLLNKKSPKEYDVFEEQQIENIINEVGYLDLVSQYISAKGYREAIDVYIEEHIPYVSKNENNFVVSSNISDAHFTQDNLEVHRELLICNWKNVYTTNYDNLLELANDIFDLNYEKIISDFQLASLSEKRGIIKVHGSLVNNSMDSNFEFDNDKTRRYIISSEDYSTYTEKHQAFSYMMRTSLLTGVFCLIGFSGNDPNFLGWLEWMRDILDKDQVANSKEEKGIRIFLLNVGEEHVDIDRQLFYKNHRIGVINIKDTRVLKEIGVPDNSDTRSIFINLFKYLRRGSDLQYDGATMSRYENLWQSVKKKNASSEIVSQIREIRSCQFVQKLAEGQYRFINRILRDGDWNQTNTELFAIAADDCGQIPSVFSSEKLGPLNDVPEWQQLSLLESTYNGLEVSNDDGLDDNLKSYYQILRHLYLLEFAEAQVLIENWHNDKDWTVCKSSLIANTNRTEALELLEKYLKESNKMPIKYFAANLANLLLGLNPPRYSYDEYMALHLDNFWDITNEIIKNIKSERTDILPYGKYEKTVYFSPVSIPIIESLRFLSFLAKTGFNLHYPGVNIVDAKDWYLVFSNIFERYPLPSLYYSLQLDNGNILRRIGQDFAYSEKLIDRLPNLLRRMLFIIKQNDRGIRLDSYYLICSELFIAVSEKEWFELFDSILSNVFIQNTDNISRRDEIYTFVKAATRRLKETEHIMNILKKLLEAVNDKNLNFISGIIYDMQLGLINDQLDDLIETFITILKEYDITKTYLLAASLYKNNLINDQLRELISSRIVCNATEVNNANLNVLFSISHFTNNNSQAIKIIKESILKHNIWDCGLDNLHSGSIPNYLQLNKLSQDIVWTKNEIKQIITNLEENVRLLIDSNFLYDDIIVGFLGKEYKALLYDMLDFVDNMIISKMGLTQYSNLSSEIKVLLERITPKGSNFDVLYNLELDISYTIQYLARCIDYYGTQKYSEYINYLIYRSLTKERRYLNLVLNFVGFIVKKHFDFMDNPEGCHKLELLLETYSDIDYRDLEINLPAMYCVMRDIAKVLSEKQIKNQAIIYWLTDEMVNRFEEN